jgi:RNA polymerase sigma-70 factor (ECF subfamily)
MSMPTGDRVWREVVLRRAVLAGDEQAWRAWYDESFAVLDSYVLWRCAGLRDLADDIVQETWLTAVRRVRSFDPQRGSFMGWLRGIAQNVIRHHLRSRQRRTLSIEGTSISVPQDVTLDRRDTAQDVIRALADLPERYEAVLRAKYLEQRSVEEIAADWQETPKAIESLLSRARQAFRECFQKREELFHE